jgi:hypothetical protein
MLTVLNAGPLAKTRDGPDLLLGPIYVARLAGPRPEYLQSIVAPPPMMKRTPPQKELKTYRDVNSASEELHVIARVCTWKPAGRGALRLLVPRSAV